MIEMALHHAAVGALCRLSVRLLPRPLAETVQVVPIEVESVENRGRQLIEVGVARNGDAPPARRPQHHLEQVRAGLENGNGEFQILVPGVRSRNGQNRTLSLAEHP